MALMSSTLDKTIPTVAALLASQLSKYITFAANDCGYSGTADELIVTYAWLGNPFEIPRNYTINPILDLLNT